MFVVRGAPTKPELRRSDIDNNARVFRVAPTGLTLCFRVGLQTWRSYGAIDAIYFVSRYARVSCTRQRYHVRWPMDKLALRAFLISGYA